MVPPTKYKISTITAVGHVGVPVDLAVLFDRVQVDAVVADVGTELAASKYTVVRAELDGRVRGDRDATRPGRRLKRKKRASAAETAAAAAAAAKNVAEASSEDAAYVAMFDVTNAAAVVKRFGNQATLVFASAEEPATRVNMKVFRNGRVQLTGVKRVEQGREIVGRVVELLTQCGSGCCATPPSLAEYRVCLINSDFDVGFRIRRALLHKLVRECFPRMSVCYEPCIYQGVRIRYYWNEGVDCSDHPGCCACSPDAVPCDGRGEGDGPGRCRKVTMSVFQSGKAIIVGAHTVQQLDDAYRFLVDSILLPHRELIVVDAAIST
jgi:TATA-box binding protein (TBP) (component of TFIID and TFIIIB)